MCELTPVVDEALLDRDDEVAGVDESGEDVVLGGVRRLKRL